MLEISDSKVVLRDFKDSDIEKRIDWETKETEWQLWDAPWQYENLTKEQKEKEFKEYMENMQSWVRKYRVMSDAQERTGFQICTKEGNYIGWCNSYFIDNEYNYSLDGSKRAIGIAIPETLQRRKGYAFHALCLFIDYIVSHGESEIYTQTWSGNERMIALATKLGFEECFRKIDFRTVRGNKYDGLTFRLNMERYQIAKQKL